MRVQLGTNRGYSGYRRLTHPKMVACAQDVQDAPASEAPPGVSGAGGEAVDSEDEEVALLEAQLAAARVRRAAKKRLAAAAGAQGGAAPAEQAARPASGADAAQQQKRQVHAPSKAPSQVQRPAKQQQQQQQQQQQRPPQRPRPKERSSGSIIFGGGGGQGSQPKQPAATKGAWICRFSSIKVSDFTMGSLDLEQAIKFSQSPGKQLAEIATYEVANRNALKASMAASSGARAPKLQVTTVAVVADRVSIKETKQGKPFSVWRLFDMQNTTLSLFLFGGAHSNAKLHKGGVVCLLDATTSNKDGRGVSLSLEDEQQVVHVGRAADFGWCCATRQNDGQRCTMFINKAKSEYCDYHVTSAYRKAKVARPELSTSALPVRPKAQAAASLRGRLAAGARKAGATFGARWPAGGGKNAAASAAVGTARGLTRAPGAPGGSRTIASDGRGVSGGSARIGGVSAAVRAQTAPMTASALARQHHEQAGIKPKPKLKNFGQGDFAALASKHEADPGKITKFNSRGAKYMKTMSMGDGTKGHDRGDGLDELGNAKRRIKLRAEAPAERTITLDLDDGAPAPPMPPRAAAQPQSSRERAAAILAARAASGGLKRR